MTNVNRKGEMGSPCLRPRKALNSLEAQAFTRTEEDPDLRHSRIHLRHFHPKPFYSSIESRYCQETVSYALAISDLKINRVFFFLILPCQLLHLQSADHPRFGDFSQKLTGRLQ